MRFLELELPNSKESLYLQIAQSLRDAVDSEIISPGELLPSTRALGTQLKVHRHTVTRALEELVSEGLLQAEPGRGYRVLSQPQELQAEPAHWSTFPLTEELGMNPEIDYAFPSGKPDLREFPTDDFFRVLRGKLRSVPPDQLLGYSSPAGSLHLRTQLKKYLARMRGLTSGEILVTHGSQEAILLLGLLLARGAEKKIAVESLGYRPAWDALRLSGAELVGVPVDQDGLRVDALEQLLKREEISLLYLTPLHQYPTTATLSRERRQKLLRLISEYQVPVIEDDYDHEFHYTGKPNRPLAGDDASGLVMYVSTFSKLVYPSSRIGYCLVPPQVFEPLNRLKRSTTRQNDLLVQETMATWMAKGGLDRHLRRMRKLYSERLEVMADELTKLGLNFRMPNGGMSIWVDLGVRAPEILEHCEQRGLILRPGSDYALTQSEQPVHHIRLGFACASPKEIREGMKTLGLTL